MTKNIILQHFDGKLRELDKLSVENISQYAKSIGADYQLVDGKPFRKHLTAPCQKAVVIDERWDDYDNVLMLDPDMFVTRTHFIDVFTVPGIGSHGPTQMRLKHKLISMGRIDKDSNYWAGSFYKMNRHTRKLLREQIPRKDDWMNDYNKPYQFEDEGILAELAYKAKIKIDYIDLSWNQCSFLPNPGLAKMIHIRTKITPLGPKRDKILNYKELAERGII